VLLHDHTAGLCIQLREDRGHQIKALLYMPVLQHITVHMRKSSSKAIKQIDMQTEKFTAYEPQKVEHVYC
jgi:hypothetical protein